MIEVISTGPFATVQDLGRVGYREYGIGNSGAADRGAHRLANRLVGNAETAATIEVTLGGLQLHCHRAVTVAVTGACCPGLPWQLAVSLPAGSRIVLGAPLTGLRSYLAVRGGLAAPAVLGSRATDTLSGLGPAPLRPGDRFDTGPDAVADPLDHAGARPPPAGPVRVVPGPRADWFAEPDELFEQPWLVGADTNRIGIRLAGRALNRARPGELATEPTLPGAIQVPPDGRPIVLGPDAPVTGGYPVIGVVLTEDLDRLAQLRPGDALQLLPAGTPRYRC
ncbi:MAG TPA: biotin-dependent carboxyltransferase family protein [Jatrophihabitans sp.]|nr:biotin-dependent carboxyltransferase family protein [Jatrophihabitans sp.]